MAAQQEVPVEKCLTDYKYSFSKDLLRGKVAFITGGGSGICFTIAEIFMRHGCHTIIAGRKLDRLQLSSKSLSEATGCRSLPVQMDVRNPQNVMAAVDKALQEFGHIDILINGAAGNFLCPLEAMSFNAFKTVLEIDTLGTYNVSKVIFDKYFKDHGGVIINITAMLHHRGTILQAHVGSAKAAIETLTRHQAVEWGPKGIRVLCVAPGPIADTEGMNRLGRGLSSQELGRRAPIRRMGSKTEIAEICLFLVTDMAGLITSSTIEADGAHWLSDGSEEQQVEMYKAFVSKI
uniref:Peroxisomal 2,4-dienoyl-CoA reductase [(3E)-enoyl-CoA-producing] n=2 Tax=Arion vulgaris TaxID=1028688 RepID=A0A0B6ZXM4_9EUPU